MQKIQQRLKIWIATQCLKQLETEDRNRISEVLDPVVFTIYLSNGRKIEVDETTHKNFSAYKKCILSVEEWLDKVEFKSNKEHQIKRNVILNSFVELIKTDMQFSTYAGFIYDKENAYQRNFVVLPQEYKGKDGKWVDVPFKPNVSIDVKKICFLSKPWKINSWFDVITRESEFEKHQQSGHFFKKIGIGGVNNGYHSITDGILHRKKVVIECTEYDDTELFENITTDGLFWYNKIDNSIIEKVIDFRAAVVFTLIHQMDEINLNI